jgi:hypothetical protein
MPVTVSDRGDPSPNHGVIFCSHLDHGHRRRHRIYHHRRREVSSLFAAISFEHFYQALKKGLRTFDLTDKAVSIGYIDG